MFFTKAGKIIAWLGTVFGFIAFVAGHEVSINSTASMFAEMLSLDTPQRAAAQSKVFRGQGATVLFYSLLLGILSEISRSVAGRKP